jgi:hypothetical protein
MIRVCEWGRHKDVFGGAVIYWFRLRFLRWQFRAEAWKALDAPDAGAGG